MGLHGHLRAVVALGALMGAGLGAVMTTSASPSATPPSVVADPYGYLNSRPDLPSTASGEAVALAATSCGTERWSIKVGTDPAAKHIGTTHPTATTIDYLRGLHRPSSVSASTRYSPLETTDWQLSATLTDYVRESDGDYHLVLKNAAGRSMIAEIPNPACMGSSPWKSAVTAARAAFDHGYSVTSSYRTTRRSVVVRGVGYFDYLHGQRGVAPNGAEVHAVLFLHLG